MSRFENLDYLLTDCESAADGARVASETNDESIRRTMLEYVLEDCLHAAAIAHQLLCDGKGE